MIDYKKKSYKNIYFPKKKRIYRRSIVIIILLTAITYTVFYSKLFEIQNIEIISNTLVNKDNIKKIIYDQFSKKRFLFFSQKNIIFFKFEEPVQHIEKNYNLRSVVIRKVFFNTLRISISESNDSIVWISDRQGFYLDQNGVVISKVNYTDVNIDEQKDIEIIRHAIIDKKLPIVYDVAERKNIVLGMRVVSMDIMKFIIQSIKELPYYLDNEVSFYLYDSENRSFIVHMTDGWEIYLSPDNDIKIQFKNLQEVLKNKIKDLRKIKYIDLRFEERVYYK